MKNLYFSFLILLDLLIIMGQDVFTKKIKTMKSTKLFFALYLVMITASQSSAQFCTQDDRFSNAEYFSINEIESLTNVTYGSAVNEQGDLEALQLDYYFPNNSIDTMTNRPFILLIHGGGFVGGDKSDWEDECKEFAKRGYVTASINYRLGYDQSSTLESIKAVYRAQQDANAALRYFVENASTVRIDTSWIFIGGSSAGAITSLFTSYVDQEEWGAIIPGIESILGSLDTSGNNLSQTFTIKGIFNNWGAGYLPATNPGELKPMISFHGELDNVVPIGTGSNGLSGSQLLHDLLTSNNVCSDFTLDPTGGHGVYKSPAGTVFRIEKASCFFKSIFCDDCSDLSTTDSIPASCSPIPTAIIETTALNEVSVYPNPFSDQLNISGLNGNEYFYLFDSFGRIIFEGNNIQNQNFSHLAIGLYILSIVGDNRFQSLKLSKH